MLERRRYVRLKDSLKIGYAIADQNSFRQGSVSGNVSGGGICLPLKHRLTVGVNLKLEVYLTSGQKPIDAWGVVIWLKGREDNEFPFLVGIKITTIDPLDRGKIINYIAKRVKEGEMPDIKWID